jgi:hypothetical protein
MTSSRKWSGSAQNGSKRAQSRSQYLVLARSSVACSLHQDDREHPRLDLRPLEHSPSEFWTALAKYATAVTEFGKECITSVIVAGWSPDVANIGVVRNGSEPYGNEVRTDTFKLPCVPIEQWAV